MGQITKLITKEWLKSLIGGLVVLVLLSATADIVSGLLRDKGAFSEILYNYALKLPSLLSKIFPIVNLLATLFTFNRLKGHSELISILALGYSPLRLYGLILSLSFIIATAQFINVSYLLPKANYKSLEKSQENSKVRSRLSDGYIWYKGKNYFASYTAFDPVKNIIYDLELRFYSNEFNASNVIKSKKVTYLEDFKWQIHDNELLKQLDVKNFPIRQLSKVDEIILSESPEDFKKFESDVSTLDIVNLKKYIQRLERTNINARSYKILFYDKIAISIICIIFALFPLSTIYQPNRRSSSFGRSVVFTLIFTISFWLIYTSAIAMGNKGTISAELAIFTIPFLFIIYITLLFTKNKKL